MRTRRRATLRLQRWDYALPGAYFVTLCTRHRRCVLGRVRDETVALSEAGRIVAETWQWLGQRFPTVQLDAFVVMPNHVHGILWLVPDDDRRGGSRAAPTRQMYVKPLGGLVGAFKTRSSKEINRLRGTPGVRVWQRGFYDHIVRHEDDLRLTRRYIDDNPRRWAEDVYYRRAEAPDP